MNKKERKKKKKSKNWINWHNARWLNTARESVRFWRITAILKAEPSAQLAGRTLTPSRIINEKQRMKTKCAEPFE